MTDKKGYEAYHDPLKGQHFDEHRKAAGTEGEKHREQHQGQNRIDRMNHLKNSRVMTVAKKAQGKGEVSTNFGTRSMR